MPVTERRGPAGPVLPGLEAFYGQALTWGDCDRDDSEEARCGWLTVPLDYDKPQGDTIKLRLLRRSATDPAKRIGSLVINPGGPGEAGTAAADWMADYARELEMGKRFDFVGFDPRGVGESEPAVHCMTDAERDAQRAADELTDQAREAWAGGFVEKCKQRTEKGAELLARVGTRDVAKDVDVLRSALGDEKLTYVGYSYGTSLGFTYASMFPRNVRALLLDAAVNPKERNTDAANTQEGLPTPGASVDTTRWLDSMRAMFDEFAQWCAPRQDCALGTVAGQSMSVLKSLTHPLERQPVDAGDGRKLSQHDAMIAVKHAMYQQSWWEKLNQGLYELKHQKRGATLLSMADEYYHRGSDGRYSNTNDAFQAITCADRGCQGWPGSRAGLPDQPVAGLPPTLVISTTMDAVTPLEGARNLAQMLSAGLLTVDGNQHAAFLHPLKRNSCVDEAGSAYLVSLELPNKNC